MQATPRGQVSRRRSPPLVLWLRACRAMEVDVSFLLLYWGGSRGENADLARARQCKIATFPHRAEWREAALVRPPAPPGCAAPFLF
eukprot:3713153-Pleurochrysis_carterae.AAC.2